MKRPDTIVVGAGPAGVLAAEALQRRGVAVQILDAGPAAGPTPPALDEGRWNYEFSGARTLDWLRVRAVGGASLAWGGWCNRFPAKVLQRGRWPLAYRSLEAAYRTVEQRIGVRPHPLGQHRAALAAGDWRVEPMCASHNSAGEGAWTALSSSLAATVTADCTALAIALRPGGGSLHVHTGDGQRELPFHRLVLACSPVETARLLLASGLDVHCPRVGQGLTYHPVAGYALLQAPAPATPPAAALCFDKGNDGHWTAEITGPYLFGSLHRDMQTRLRAAAWPPADARVTFIHCMTELLPNPERRVELGHRRDTLGRRVPHLVLSWSDEERERIAGLQQAAQAIAEAIATDGGQLVEYLDPVGSPLLFHEAGTCAFGHDPGAPCNPFGQVRAAPRIWVADASVFPSSGDRHPTLTILAHATRAGNAAAA